MISCRGYHDIRMHRQTRFRQSTQRRVWTVEDRFFIEIFYRCFDSNIHVQEEKCETSKFQSIMFTHYTLSIIFFSRSFAFRAIKMAIDTQTELFILYHSFFSITITELNTYASILIIYRRFFLSKSICS